MEETLKVLQDDLERMSNENKELKSKLEKLEAEKQRNLKLCSSEVSEIIGDIGTFKYEMGAESFRFYMIKWKRKISSKSWDDLEKVSRLCEFFDSTASEIYEANKFRLVTTSFDEFEKSLMTIFTSFEYRLMQRNLLNSAKLKPLETVFEFSQRILSCALGMLRPDEECARYEEVMVSHFLQGISSIVPVQLWQENPNTLNSAVILAQTYLDKVNVYGVNALKFNDCSERLHYIETKLAEVLVQVEKCLIETHPDSANQKETLHAVVETEPCLPGPSCSSESAGLNHSHFISQISRQRKKSERNSKIKCSYCLEFGHKKSQCLVYMKKRNGVSS